MGEHPRYSAKLTPTQVRKIRKMHYESGVSQSEIARQLGMHSSTISRLVRGERWSAVK
jgi:DNA-binding transcriptional regulator LsrR (DeoR family)